MLLLLFQPGPPPIPIGIDPLVTWLIGVMLTTLSTTVIILWRQGVAEGKRKDELIDRLLRAEFENADANKRSVSLLEEERRRPR